MTRTSEHARAIGDSKKMKGKKNFGSGVHYKIKDSDVSVTEEPNGEFSIKVKNNIDPDKFTDLCVVENEETGEQLALNKKSVMLLALAPKKLDYQEISRMVSELIYANIDIHKLIDSNMQSERANRKRAFDQAKYDYINGKLHEYYRVEEGLREFCQSCDIPPGYF